MEKPSYQPGDEVVLLTHNARVVRFSTVAEVKMYKRGPKLTLDDGTQWDVNGDCSWGTRSNPNWSSPSLTLATDAHRLRHRAQKINRRINNLPHHLQEWTLDAAELSAVEKALTVVEQAAKKTQP